MDYRLWSIADILSDKEYKTSNDLAGSLGLSEKTIRTRMQELSREAQSHGVEVISRPRHGYCLQITDKEKWLAFRQDRYHPREVVPVDSNERVDYILAALLNRSDYIKLETLAEFLYISTKTLTNEMKRVEFILERFELQLKRKPYYGMKAVGHEFNKRCCILQNFYISRKPFWEMKHKQEEGTEAIAAVFLRLTREQGIKFTETTFQNAVLYISMSISRMKKGLFLTDMPEFQQLSEVGRELIIARKLYEAVVPNGLAVTEAEIGYTGIYIAGKQILHFDHDYAANMIVSEELDQLVNRVLEEIFLTYGVEFRGDLNLRLMLLQHLKPMAIRLRYGIPVETVIGRQVKEHHILAYHMAQLAEIILIDHYQRCIPKEEIFCIAMYFALALAEKRETKKRKNNILLVCVSGRVSSRMLIYRFEKEFSDYIESLQVCGMYEFDDVDLKSIDFIFTTVPIYKKVSVPIMEIHDMMEHNDIMAVRRFLEVGDKDIMNDFYKKRLFFVDVEGGTKEEVITELCVLIREVTELPEGFEESVIRRESMGSTDFGNLTAIPHPSRMMTDETIVAVAVLRQEIIWSVNPVRVVILTSLKAENDEQTQKFYEVTANFLSDREAVQSLINEPSYETFEKMINYKKAGGVSDEANFNPR